MKRVTRLILQMLPGILGGLAVVCLFLAGVEIEPEDITRYAPRQPLLAALAMLGLYGVKSISVFLPMLPLQLAGATPFGLGDYVLIPNVREALKGDLQSIKAYVLGDTVKEFELYMAPLTADERRILADGCLINFYKH